MADGTASKPAPLRFATPRAFEAWLRKNNASSDGARTAALPPDLQAALDARPEARSFFAQLDGANRYAVLWRVQTAKRPETRSRRIETLVEMLARGEKIH
jgi:uncharacterized protein YdeI (YjbR/CyaY-like superfamily)